MEGKTRAMSRYSASEVVDKHERQSRSMAIVLHGDAAFAGQGIVYESFGFSQLPACVPNCIAQIVSRVESSVSVPARAAQPHRQT
eukprot:SAG11_NODE_208_length_12354_cov_19.490167_6_plen_85_part_00